MDVEGGDRVFGALRWWGHHWDGSGVPVVFVGCINWTRQKTPRMTNGQLTTSSATPPPAKTTPRRSPSAATSPTPLRCMSSRPPTSSSPIADTTSDTPSRRRGRQRPPCTHWQTRGDIPHPSSHHAPSWPTPFHTADRPNIKPKQAGVHTPAQEAQHRHDARPPPFTMTTPCRAHAPPPQGCHRPFKTARSQESSRTA